MQTLPDIIKNILHILQITLKDEKQNRTREAYSIHDDTAVLPQERGQQDAFAHGLMLTAFA